jgi:hypothetical protein
MMLLLSPYRFAAYARMGWTMSANVCLQDDGDRNYRRPSRAATHHRHWWPWLAGAAGLLTLAVMVASVWFVMVPAAPAALALPRTAAAAPAGPVSGTWIVGQGSLAGFRVRASAMFLGNDVVGLTSAVNGSLSISGNWVTAARFSVGLADLTVNGKAQPQLAQSLRTQQHPTASFKLTQVVTLTRAFTAGRVVTRRILGWLSMNGTMCAVTVTITARRDGNAIQIAGSIPVEFAYWGIAAPPGAGILGSLADSGVADFRLVLHRA